jgi:hypothetical protein
VEAVSKQATLQVGRVRSSTSMASSAKGWCSGASGT